MIYKFFQKLPIFKGKLRLAKVLIFNKEKPRQFTINHGLTIAVPNLIENISFELLVNGIYEQYIIDLIIKELPQNGIYVDVGANIGALALIIAKLRPDVRVYAFEPAPIVFKYLELNKTNNKLDNLEVINKAIHIKDDDIVPFYSPLSMNGKGSFAPVFTKEAILVKTISLDTFFITNKIQPSFIKIDVEGFELLILDSMESFLKSNKKCKIAFEFVDWAESLANLKIGSAQLYLLNLNYNLYNLDSKTLINQHLEKGAAMILAFKDGI